MGVSKRRDKRTDWRCWTRGGLNEVYGCENCAAEVSVTAAGALVSIGCVTHPWAGVGRCVVSLRLLGPTSTCVRQRSPAFTCCWDCCGDDGTQEGGPSTDDRSHRHQPIQLCTA